MGALTEVVYSTIENWSVLIYASLLSIAFTIAFIILMQVILKPLI